MKDCVDPTEVRFVERENPDIREVRYEKSSIFVDGSGNYIVQKGRFKVSTGGLFGRNVRYCSDILQIKIPYKDSMLECYAIGKVNKYIMLYTKTQIGSSNFGEDSRYWESDLRKFIEEFIETHGLLHIVLPVDLDISYGEPDESYPFNTIKYARAFALGINEVDKLKNFKLPISWTRDHSKSIPSCVYISGSHHHLADDPKEIYNVHVSFFIDPDNFIFSKVKKGVYKVEEKK